MRHLIALIALLSASAWAQTPPCYPFINGVHPVAPRMLSGEQGQHIFWFCSARGGDPKEYGFSCLHGQCSKQVLTAVQTAIIAATAKVTTANSLWAQHVTYSCYDPVILAEQTLRGALCRERKALSDAYGPAWAKEMP